jgi:putative peptidoglycan lipid II flippase
MIVARFYGSTGQTDSFFFALIIPEMLRTLIVSGAVASVFIPLMTEIQRAGKEHEARRLAGMMISFISLLAIVAVAICELFAPGLVRFSEVLSFAGEPLSAERLRLTSELIRILLPVVLLVGLWGRIIFLLCVGYRGDVHDVAWAFVIGHFIQVLFHIPSLWKAGIRPVAINWRHPMLMRFLQLAPVAVLAYAAPAVNAFVGQGIALNLSESSASSLMYAFRIQQLPIAIFGVSVATAIFPTLSRHAVAGLGKDVVATLARGLRMTCLATLPAMVFFVVLPNETIRLLLERGAFTSTNTGDVSLALYWYSWAMLPMSLLLLTARTFFSEKDMRTPALIGIFTIIIYYLLSLLFSRIYGFSGIAMTGGAVSWLTLIISIFILHRRYSRSASLFKAIGAKSPLHMIIAGLAEALVLLGYRHFAGSLQGTWALFGAIVLATIIGGAAYLLVLRLLGNEDLSSTLRMLFRRR